jgi:hypothetical protein
MKAKDLIREINKSKRFIPADLDVDIIISKNNKGITFYFIKEEKILHKFTIQED